MISKLFQFYIFGIFFKLVIIFKNKNKDID